MITCLSCGLTSDNDINGKCPVCWADLTEEPENEPKIDKEGKVSEPMETCNEIGKKKGLIASLGKIVHKISKKKDDRVYYDVDIQKIICQCNQFIEQRIQYGLDDPRRLCTHLIKAYHQTDSYPSTQEPFKAGITLFASRSMEHPMANSFDTYELDNNLIYTFYDKTDSDNDCPWIVIYYKNKCSIYLPEVRTWEYANGLPNNNHKFSEMEQNIILNLLDKHGLSSKAYDGTYDKSYFIDTVTGNFCFPKYKHDKSFIVKIIDETDYKQEKSDIFSELDSFEKETFSIYDFEDNFCNMIVDISAEPFSGFFNKKNSSHLKPYGYLKGCGEELIDIANEYGLIRSEYGLAINESKYLLANKSFLKKLLADECLSLYKFTNEDEKNKYIKSTLLLLFKSDELKAFGKKLGLKISLPKSQLADQLIDSNMPFNLPEAVVLNDKFHNMFEQFANVYIEDVKANLKRFHPFYIPEVWEVMADNEACSIVNQKAKIIFESKYWEKQ